MCITVALIPIVALFLGGDALGFVEFGEKVHLAGNLGLAPGADGTASPYHGIGKLVLCDWVWLRVPGCLM